MLQANCIVFQFLLDLSCCCIYPSCPHITFLCFYLCLLLFSRFWAPAWYVSFICLLGMKSRSLGHFFLHCEPSTFFFPGQQEALTVTVASHTDCPLPSPTSSRQTDRDRQTHTHTHRALNQSVYKPTRTTEFTHCKSRTVLPHQYGYVGVLPLIKDQS